MAGYVFVDAQKNDKDQWTLEIKGYKGSKTAEEFANQFGLVAINDNADEDNLTYSFIGTRSNVMKAFDEYMSVSSS